QALEYRKQGKIQDALMAASEAALLDPLNPEYVMTREVLKQQIVGARLETANHLADAGNNSAAASELREALAIDPQNGYLQQRLRDVLPSADPAKHHALELLASVDSVDLQPAPGKRNLHLQGDTRAIYNQIGQAFGIFMEFDQNLSTRNLKFDLDYVDFYTATAIAGKMLKTFWAPVSGKDAIVANDTQENRRQYERMAVRTYYVNNVTTPNDLNDVINVLKTIFDMKFVSLQAKSGTITVRGPREKVEAISALLENLMDAKPEILLDIHEIEFDADRARNYGLNLPTDFTIFNIPSEIRRVLGSDAQPVIDELNQTGTIDPSKINPSDLTNLQSSPLIQPFIFFGKGLTLTGVTVGPVSGSLKESRSYSANLEHVTLRAIDGEPALFRVGTKFPIVNSFFTTVGVSNAGQAVVGSTPQFTYVDLGLSLKTTPHYHSDGDIGLEFELEISGVGTSNFNSIPDITSRSFKGSINARDGEPSVVAGVITDQELRSARGYPGLGQLPGVSAALDSNTSDHPHQEILIVVTPHLVRKPFHNKGTGVLWSLDQ
ncbi:MAG: hypothetical protein ACRD4F_06285, partial [Candidatus Angelobacter sp.]